MLGPHNEEGDFLVVESPKKISWLDWVKRWTRLVGKNGRLKFRRRLWAALGFHLQTFKLLNWDYSNGKRCSKLVYDRRFKADNDSASSVSEENAA